MHAVEPATDNDGLLAACAVVSVGLLAWVHHAAIPAPQTTAVSAVLVAGVAGCVGSLLLRSRRTEVM